MSGNPPERSVADPGVVLQMGESIRLEVPDGPRRLSPTQQAYLFLLGHAGADGIRRSEVIWLLWAESESPSTRHRLRQLTYAVNRKAGLVVASAEGEFVLLDCEVQLKWTSPRVGAALPVPTPQFSDRMLELREQLESAASLGSVRDLDAARLADHPEAMIASVRERRTSPGSWRDVLWALLRTGRIREADYELQRIMGDELPKEGLPTARRIAAQSDLVLSMAAAGGEASIPIMGRDQDVRRVHQLLVAGSSCILITGARGVGRSRVLGQAAATILSNQEDTVVLTAHGMPAERHTPFGGLSQLLSDELLVQAFGELGQPQTEIIRRALPVQFEADDFHTIAPLGGPGSYLRVARALADLLRLAYGEAEVMLIVDDLNHLDRSSMEVVARLVLVSGVRLLGTWCTNDEEGLNELLFRFRGNKAELVPLLDLPLREAARLARFVAPDLGEEGADDIARLGGGRPGRIVELLRALEGSPLLPSPVGPGLEELLRRRIREMDPVAQDVLVYLAVSGGRLDVSTLGKLLHCHLLETSGYIRSLEEAGLVQMDGDRAAVLSNLLLRFIHRELPGPQRRETHSYIADHLLSDSQPSDPALLAHHLMESGRPKEAALWFKRAGFDAQERTAYDEAMVLLERCVVASNRVDPEIARTLGAIHSGMGDFRQAMHWFSRARIGYADRGDAIQDVEMVLSGLQASLEVTQNIQDLVKEAKAQLARADALRCNRLTAQALDLLLRIADYKHDRALVDSGRRLMLDRLGSLPRSTPPWLALTGSRLVYLGDPSRGLRLARTAYLGLRETPVHRVTALNRLLISYMVLGQLHTWRGAAVLASMERLVDGVGDIYLRFSLLCNRALWEMDCANWALAQETLDAAERFAGSKKAVGNQMLAVNRAVLAVRRGRPLDAIPVLDDMDSWLPSPQESINAAYKACRLLAALEQAKMAAASDWFDELSSLDTGFPFSADLSLVPISCANYLARIGKRNRAEALLNAAKEKFGPHNPAAARRVAMALHALGAGRSVLWSKGLD